MSKLGKALTFPPILFSLILIIGLAATQGYIQYTEAANTPELQHIAPTISTDSHTYQKGSWMQITVNVAEDHDSAGHDDAEMEGMEGMEGDQHDDDEAEEGHGHDDGGEAGDFAVRIIIYSPDGSIFAIEEGVTDHDGESTFDVFFGSESPAGIYTIVAEAELEGQPAVIGETVTIEVAD